MESINPNDIMTLDLNSISYLTLKNGDMVLLDDTIPQKTNGNTKNNKESNLNENELKSSHKEIKLEISSPLKISFEGKKDTNKYKSDFKLCSKIIKNVNFNFIGTKKNLNNFSNNEKENINSLNINNKENKNNFKKEKNFLKNKDIDNNKNNNKNNESSDSMRPSLKESEIKPITNNKNINEHDVDFSKIEKLDFNQSNLNTNLSIPLMNFTNNLDNNQGNRRKSRASRIFGVSGGKKNNRISVNAVCSLNIKAEEKYKINLISQFNDIVDKLNAERDKKPIYNIIEDSKDRNVKYYEFYKNKFPSNVKKNMETLNYNSIMDLNNDYNKNNTNFKTLNNYYKRKSVEFNGFHKSNGHEFGNRYYKENIGKSPCRIYPNKITNFRDKIYKYSSELVFPSNKIIQV